MTIPAIGAIGALGSGQSVTSALGAQAGGVSAAGGASGESFGDMLARGIQSVADAQSKADNLAVQAATGDLTNVADYTVAASEAALMTNLASTLRSKAVEAFNTIMGMQA